MVETFFRGDISKQSGSILLMPGRRSCTEAKFHLVKGLGGVSGSMVTYRTLGERLYDHFGFERPVLDLSGREILIREIMEKMDLPSLKVGKDVRSKMVSHITREVGDLIAGEVEPEKIFDPTGRKRDLALVLGNYLAILEERELTDSEQVPVIVKEALQRGKAIPWNRMGIYLSSPLPRAWSDMVDALKTRMDDVVEVDIPFSKTDEAGYFFTIPPRSKKGRQTIGSERKVGLIKAMTPFYEVDSVARHLKERILDGVDISRCAVVFPSRRRYDTIVKVVFERYGIPVDMGNDLKLDQVPVVHCILSLISLPSNGYRRDDILSVLSTGLIPTDGLDWRDLERITRRGYILGGGKDAAGRWVDDLLKYSQEEGVGERERGITSEWAKFLNSLFSIMENLSKGKRSVGERCNALIEVIERVGIWNGISSRDSDDLDLVAFDNLIQSLRSLRKRSKLLKMGPTDHSRFMEILRSEVEMRKITTNHSTGGVQILGLQGAIGLRFDVVVIGGCTSNQLPVGRGGFRIFPEKERIDLGMKEVEDRRIDLEQMASVMNSSREVILSYHMEDGGRPVMPSSFIDNLELEEISSSSNLLSTVDILKRIGELEDPALDLYDRREGDIDQLMCDPSLLMGMLNPDISMRIRRGIEGRKKRCSAGPNDHRGTISSEETIAALRERFGPEHVWSASKLETYRECPYSFLARYVMGIREREDLEPGVPPEKKGLIFHSIADTFYSRWMDLGRYTVKAAELDQAWKVMKTVAEEELARYHYSGPYWDALRDQLLGVDDEEGLLLEFLKVEGQYTGAFRVDGTEVRFGPFLGKDPVRISPIGDEDGFLLQGSIDRVDRMRTDKGDLFYIWDYKTGSKDISNDSLQVPLYLAALRRSHPGVFPGGGGYYYIRRKGSIRRDPVLGKPIWEKGDSSEKQVENVSNRIRDDVVSSLEMIDSIRCGLFAPDPACRSKFCHFVDLCRRRETQ